MRLLNKLFLELTVLKLRNQRAIFLFDLIALPYGHVIGICDIYLQGWCTNIWAACKFILSVSNKLLNTFAFRGDFRAIGVLTFVFLLVGRFS